MPKLIVFNHVTLDGYFVDRNGDMRWAHRANKDAEFDAFVEENAKGDSVLLFGRITYQLMAGYWPSEAAKRDDPVVAGLMNSLSKVVFSKTLQAVKWENTQLVKGDFIEEIRKLKQRSGKDIGIFGSSDLAVTLVRHGLIDEYRIMVNPVVLGDGKRLLAGIDDKLDLKLFKTKPFKSGNVLLYYEPGKR